MIQRACVALLGIFIAGLVSAQSILPGFPPGVFQSRAAIDAGTICTFPTLTGLLGRWRADTGVTTSGGNVTAVTDQSGNGKTLTNTGNVPFNATGYNSKPAFDFLAANQAGLGNTSFDGLGTGATGSFFFVGQMKTNTEDSGGAIAYIGTAGGTDFLSGGSAAILARDSTSDGVRTTSGGSNIASTAITLATNFRIGAIFDAVNTTQYVNNSAGTPGANGRSWDTNATFLAIGNRLVAGVLGGATGRAWDGPIAEIAIGSAAWDATERNNLDAYFTCQWGT